MTAATMLSSDVLERQFGDTRVEILSQDSLNRIIVTVAAETGDILEVSWVRFLPGGAQAFRDVHAAVVGGQSMGKAFRGAGVVFERKTKSVSKRVLPAVFGKRFGRGGEATVVEVDILVGERKVPYARILETYSPVVTWPEPAEVSPTFLPEITEFAQILETL